MISSLLTSALCLVLPTVSFCDSVQRLDMPISFTNCGADVIKEVVLSPCTSEPCVFHHGTDVSVSITFTTTADSLPTLRAKVFGIVAGVPIAFPLPQDDGCHNCNIKCPVQQGEHKYINTFPVLKTYPDIKLPVKWEIISGNDTVLCFVFPMAIEE